MARGKALFNTEDDDDMENLRYFDSPFPANDDKQFLSIILNSPLSIIEEAIKPLIYLIDDITSKVYIIKKNLTVFDTDDLTLDELASIHLYISEGFSHKKSIYYLVNKTLRRNVSEELQPWHSYLKLLLTALSKLPSIGEHCIIYRGVRSCDLSDDYKDDGIYTWWTFGSGLQSLEQMKLPTFLGKLGLRTLFKIDCYSGKRLPFSDDDEIILMPGFRFQVVGKLPSLDDLHTIYIREIPPSSTDIIPPVSVITKIEPPQELSPLEDQTTQQQKTSIKPRKSLKITANRIIKMTKILQVCSDHILELSGKKLPVTDLRRILSERLTQKITILNLSKTNLKIEKLKIVAEMLKTNHNLIELNLSYNPLGNNGCLSITETLREHKHLLTLNLYNTKLTSDAGPCLGELLSFNHHLRSLHLGVNSLSTLGIKSLLNDNIQLHHLNLCCNKIDQDGCQSLANLLEKNQTLTQLDMGGNPIKDDGFKILCDSLMNNETLIDLRVWHCQISNIEPMCNLLESKSSLKQLDMEGNQITDENVPILLSVAENNKTIEQLNISDNRLSEKFKKTFRKQKKLRLSVILK